MQLQKSAKLSGLDSHGDDSCYFAGKPPSLPALNFPRRIEPEVVDPLYKTSTKVTDIRRHRRGRSRILSDCIIL